MDTVSRRQSLKELYRAQMDGHKNGHTAGVLGIYLAGWWIVLIPFSLHRLSNYIHAGYELVRSVARRQ